MKRPTLKLSLFLLVLFICSLSNNLVVYAAGQGDIKPLSYVSCELEDGSSLDDPNGIILQPKFTLIFDKNVVDMLYWENNSKSISLFTDDKINVPIDVTKIDDTVDFAHRQHIFVSPSNPLNPDETYYLYISPNLTAKNGVATLGGTTDGKGITLTFKTKKQVVSQNTETTPTTNANNTEENTEGTSSIQPKDTSNNTIEAPRDNGNASQQNSESSVQEVPKEVPKEVSKPDTLPNTTNDNTAKAEASSKLGEGSVIGNSSDGTVDQTEVIMGKNTSSNNSVKWLCFIAAIILIFWITIEIFLRRRKIKGRGNKPEGLSDKYYEEN